MCTHAHTYYIYTHTYNINYYSCRNARWKLIRANSVSVIYFLCQCSVYSNTTCCWRYVYLWLSCSFLFLLYSQCYLWWRFWWWLYTNFCLFSSTSMLLYYRSRDIFSIGAFKGGFRNILIGLIVHGFTYGRVIGGV